MRNGGVNRIEREIGREKRQKARWSGRTEKDQFRHIGDEAGREGGCKK